MHSSCAPPAAPSSYVVCAGVCRTCCTCCCFIAPLAQPNNFPFPPLFPSYGSAELKFADSVELDPQRLATRQRQIDFGMNTQGYETYLEQIPR